MKSGVILGLYERIEQLHNDLGTTKSDAEKTALQLSKLKKWTKDSEAKLLRATQHIDFARQDIQELQQSLNQLGSLGIQGSY